ncbi:CGNR zinc finger domain-containing protein [Streptomyces lasiicapitis]|uniref:CGNR zinc finger domain-containing protein n=1 Tax=Streptomyces lasiicapitis TaxID=1923961 RepID=UPI00365EB889
MAGHGIEATSFVEEAGTAPLPLRWVEELINTHSLVFRADLLRTPEDLLDWLRARDLVPDGTSCTRTEFDQVIRAREGLRALVAANNAATTRASVRLADDTPDGVVTGMRDELAAIARTSPLVLDVTSTPPRLVPMSPESVGGAVAAMLGMVAESVTSGAWSRLKVCRKPGCRWAYYDHSRNRARTWCSMETCGNQAKAHAFRQRRAVG